MAGYLNSGNQTTEPWSGFATCIVNLYLWIMELQNWKSMGLPASLFVLIDTAWLGLILSMRQASADDVSKNDNILEFHDHIWNRHGKCIQISTNMPGIGLVILEKAIEMLRILRKQILFCVVNHWPCAKY